MPLPAPIVMGVSTGLGGAAHGHGYLAAEALSHSMTPMTEYLGVGGAKEIGNSGMHSDGRGLQSSAHACMCNVHC